MCQPVETEAFRLSAGLEHREAVVRTPYSHVLTCYISHSVQGSKGMLLRCLWCLDDTGRMVLTPAPAPALPTPSQCHGVTVEENAAQEEPSQEGFCPGVGDGGREARGAQECCLGCRGVAEWPSRALHRSWELMPEPSAQEDI